MSLNEYTYGTVDGVHRRVSWVIPNKIPFDGTTIPTGKDVEDILDQVASKIHMVLSKNGYPIDTAAALEVSSPRTFAFLRKLNEDGAAADILMMFPTSYDPEAASNPQKYYTKQWEDGLTMFTTEALENLDLNRTSPQSNQLLSGSYDNADGDVKYPIFKRDQFDNGIWRITDDSDEDED